jgi:site-specific recombinase XerD
MAGRAILARGAPFSLPAPYGAHALPAPPDLRRLREQEGSAIPERLTIAALIDRYLTWKAGVAAKDTIRTYRDGLRHFSEFLAMSGINAFEEEPDVLPASIMEEYIVWVRQRPSRRSGKPLATSSVALYHAAVADLFKYAARRKLLPERFRWAEMKANAAETLGKVQRRSARHDRRIPLLVAHVDNLSLPPVEERKGISRLELLRNRALMHLLLSSGMRREEVTTLNRGDVEDGWTDTAVIVGKGSKERRVFWDNDTRKAVHAWMAARSDDLVPLFIRLDNRRGIPGPYGEHWRMTPQSVWDIVKKYAEPFGIHATPHAFRHAMASAMLNNGAPLSLIQDLLGHANITTTKTVYAAYEQRTLRKGFDEFNPSATQQVAELEAEQERRRKG